MLATDTTLRDSRRGANTDSHPFRDAVLIGVIAFLTLVDLFATQAILPSLVVHYGTTPAATGLAVNASTFGMAAAGLAVAMIGRKIDRRRAVIISLATLSLPTCLLALAPGLGSFMALRIVQGLLMATAFTMTLAYLAEGGNPMQATLGSAAYVTGNVASNLFGRLLAAAAVDHVGLSGTFVLFAVLNLAGAALAATVLRMTGKAQPQAPALAVPSSGEAIAIAMVAGWRGHLRDKQARAAFAIGFCILFAFIGTFTYVNFVLTRAPFAIHPMQLGLVYFVFLPSLITTPLAGRVITRWSTSSGISVALLLALVALPLLLSPSLPLLLAGLTLVAVGTFLAQAIATGYVGRHAKSDRAAAGGLYLASYFLGGLAGSFALGQAFDHWGWTSCVSGVGLALLAAIGLSRRLID
ncbi:MAG TPA: MFS transporter [Terriglobales bacterium]|nr:MFS transporter [Terriglobales bacterium]